MMEASGLEGLESTSSPCPGSTGTGLGWGFSSPISQVKKMKVLKKRGRQREAEPAETEKATG